MATSVKELEDEMRRRGLLVSEESVLNPPKTTLQEFQAFGESLLKGAARGVVGLVGGWGNLYDYIKKNRGSDALTSPSVVVQSIKDMSGVDVSKAYSPTAAGPAGLALSALDVASAFSSPRLMQGIKDLTGVDINKIPGYTGVYEFGAAGAPAALMTAVGVPGLFGRTVPGVAGEFGVAGSTGLLAQSVAPDSPLAQFALQSLPYAAKGSYLATQRAVNAPTGLFPSVGATQELLRVGRMTPGELGQGRRQLATEARVEAAPSSGQAPIAFRRGQALDVEGFLTNLFERSAGPAVDVTRAQATTSAVVDAFNNFGKALSSKLRSDARRDFGAVQNVTSQIDTTPVVTKAKELLAGIAPELSDFATLKQSLERIIKEYEIPGSPGTTTTSPIIGPTGQPVSVVVTPPTPASIKSIDLKRLQDNLSVWGDAAYSGKADFGRGNIFEGVAPGKAKGISLSMLQAFRQSLDDAIAAGVPGADKLVQARNNFRDNVARIEEFAERPLTKYFDRPVSQLVPEEVIAKLKKAPDSQQKLLIDVMQNSGSPNVQAVLDAVRRSRLDDVLAKGREAGAAATDPTFNIQQTLKALQSNGDLAALFPVARDLQDAQLAVKFMQQVLTREGAGGLGSTGGVVYAGVRAAGGTSGAALVANSLTDLVRATLSSPAALSKVLFEGDNRKLLLDLAKKKTTPEKAYEAVKTLGQNVGVLALRGGPALDVGAPETPEMAPASSEDAGAIEAEMRRRGLLQ